MNYGNLQGIIFTALMATACSSATSTAAPSGADASTPTGPMSDAGPVTTVDGAVPPGTDASAGAPTEMVGAVTAVSDITMPSGGAAQSEYRASAYFVKRPIAQGGTPPTTIGPCVVEVLDPNAPDPMETIVPAGSVRILGGTTPVDLEPGPNGDYAGTESSTSSLWMGGQMLTATGGGDTGVPVFSASLAAPGKLQITAPILPDSNGSLMIARSAPLTAIWNGTSSGNVILYLDIATTDKAYTVTCTYATSAGTGEIPTAALQMLPAGSGSYDWYVLTKAAATAPSWKINFAASSSMQDVLGRMANGQTTLQ